MNERNKANKFILRNVSFEQVDMDIVNEFARVNGLGGKGFSTAIRIIIRNYASNISNRPTRIHLLDDQAK